MLKKAKRYIAWILVLLLCFSLTGCKAPETEDDIELNTNVPTIQNNNDNVEQQTPPATQGTPEAPEDSEPEPEPKPEDKEPSTSETPEDPEPEKEDDNPSTPTLEPEQPTETPDEKNENDPPAPEETPDYTTSCMTFNVLAYNTGGSTAYAHPETRAPWIMDTITKYNPDLLGCQEVVRKANNSENYDMYTYLTTTLAKEGYDYSGLMDSQNRGGSVVKVSDYTIASGLLIFWKKDRFELKDYGARVYSNDAGRHFQWVKLYDNAEKITILMTNTHMSINPNNDANQGAAKRAQQANQLYQFWSSNCKKGMALYATGDYNHKTNSTAFGNLTKGQFVSTRDISQSANAASGIDHVLVNGDIQDCFKYHRCEETYEPAGVAKGTADKRNKQYCASDHYAVIAYCSNAYRD